ncbi:LADA_0D03422g1_1 [Lachancea dasiensis]|uniref:LADA_0D03422g1_1 n=1 Tax=Lachancea dasiensis TaxID=1072105 RepID=A0A1G4J4V5_9SACH|nr:LADA_0D03422g1_1 [Lachancea dasiensis]
MLKNSGQKVPKMLAQELEKLHIAAAGTFILSEAPSETKNGAGRPNQAVTKPISVDPDTGEVIVRKSTGKSKIRKGQSSDEYERQRDHFFNVEKGPVWTPVGWMTKEDPLDRLDKNPESDIRLKQTRQKLMSHCHLLYYRKQYEDCAQICQTLITRFEVLESRKKIQKEIDELAHILQRCRAIAQA